MQSPFENLAFGKFILNRQAQAHDLKSISGFSGLPIATIDQNPIGDIDSRRTFNEMDPKELGQELRRIVQHFMQHVEGQYSGQGRKSPYVGLP